MARSTFWFSDSEQKYIFLQGGLGNQLFQISLNVFLNSRGINSSVNPLLLATYSRGVTKRTFETKPILDRSEINYLDASSHLLISKIVRSRSVFKEKFAYNFDEEKLQEINAKKLIFGYFQSLKLVDEIYEEIRLKLQKKINFSGPSFNLAMHVRAGDYLNKKNRDIHGVISSSYYERAIEKAFEEDNKILKIMIISEDLEYAKKLLYKSRYFKKMDFSRTKNSWEDLNLLLRSRYIIIANSSFSWWAGYLATKEFNSGVIMPKMWTKKILSSHTDLVHTNWQIV